MATPQPLLSVRDLVVEFPLGGTTVRAVDDLSVDVAAGRRLGIVGESGSGKSTLALAVLGLLEPPGRVAAGTIALDGEDLTRASERQLRQIRGGQVGMIFQDALGSLNPVMSIGAQLEEALRQHERLTRDEARTRAADLLREVGVPSPAQRLQQYPHEFSGGMRQRVMIAMALACGPRLLIADEPTTALDVTTQAGVVDLLRRLSDERDMAVVFITHDLGVIAGFADEVLVMYAGAPVEHGPVEQIFAAPAHPYTQRLLAAVPRITDDRATALPTIPGTLPRAGELLTGCRFEPRCPLGRGRERCRTERPALVERISGERAACHFAEEAVGWTPPPGDAHEEAEAGGDERDVLVVDAVEKGFRVRGEGGKRRRLRAVDGVGFTLGSGEALGIVGESGSGKSTLARVVLGLLEADAGSASFEGRPLDLTTRKRPRALRGRLQMVFQDPGDSLDPTMTVGAIIGEPLRLQGSTADLGARVRELADLCGLGSELLGRRPLALSGGQRQRVAIARALATNPAVVACDEAVSSLDVSVRAQILNLLRDLRRRLGVAYLFISHDLSVVRHVCDRVVVMYAGHIVERATVDELFAAPRHPYTVALLSAVPVPDPVEERQRRRIRLDGEPPDVSEDVVGCVFASRCFRAQERCRVEAPPLVEHRPGHDAACHFPVEGETAGVLAAPHDDVQDESPAERPA